MKITATRIKEIIREELARVNEAVSREAAEEGASMYNSEHYGLSHRQLVQMIMKHCHIDAAYPTYLEFRDRHEHYRGDYVEDSEYVDFEIDRRRMNKPMMENEK